VTEHDEVFTAACVQFDVQAADVAANLAAVLAGIDEAAEAGARLCVLPELWSTSFVDDYSPQLIEEAAAAERELGRLSAAHDLVIVGSAIDATGGQLHNSARVYDRGATVGIYRKIHLFSPNAEDRHHLAGDEPLVVDTSVGRLGVIICYDLRFPELTRYYLHAGAEILAVPAQWPEARAQHWRTLLRARAIENEMFVIGCNRTGQGTSLKTNEPLIFPGDGRIVEPTGEILASGAGEAGAVLGVIERRKVLTMRRIMPIQRDLRPSVYRRLFAAAWPEMIANSREGTPPPD